jgi:hypothetical protein
MGAVGHPSAAPPDNKESAVRKALSDRDIEAVGPKRSQLGHHIASVVGGKDNELVPISSEEKRLASHTYRKGNELRLSEGLGEIHREMKYGCSV